MKIGQFHSDNILFLAPMAGVTDLPFRKLCKTHGAGWVVSEMVWSHKHLYETPKTQRRIDHSDEVAPKIIQIAGGDPIILAESASLNVHKGADIIDINMGCPAKKVCNKLAGSALMQNEQLVDEILCAVVNAVDVPVTLKIRTGWSKDNKNAFKIAQIAEDAGIQALTVHGRTRDQKYTGNAEYDLIAQIKQRINIPVIANGDITTPEKAKEVLNYTQANALMIGRGAHGNPWLFKQINDFLQTGHYQLSPNFTQKLNTIIDHVKAMHSFYGDYMGVRFARKHITWYFEQIQEFDLTKARQHFNKLTTPEAQLDFLANDLLIAP
ncbi:MULTISPECIES: tRNA dihydrouridine synthase DusB [Cysteiniphilum]|uniref:tRNA dihydrouridine synthase DusB n=1 Tax=Cysteiniphilum TaxID=2056696 RepID=UPI00177E393F|nr:MULTISPECIES: tRNA dihydrouridine synthase DusB [Cysteiniphilum]